MIPAVSQLKALIAPGRVAKFVKYFDENLWYSIKMGEEGLTEGRFYPPVWYFEFPVPIDDIGGAIFLAEDKAILFMRYIRKYLQMLETAQTHMYPPLTKPAEGQE